MTGDRRLLPFSYRYWSPVYRNFSTLDCAAETHVLAVQSARRYIAGQNQRLRRAGVPWRLKVPRPHQVWQRRTD